MTSYEAQVKHYTEYIKSKEASDNWQFVDVYTDKDGGVLKAAGKEYTLERGKHIVVKGR